MGKTHMLNSTGFYYQYTHIALGYKKVLLEQFDSSQSIMLVLLVIICVG